MNTKPNVSFVTKLLSNSYYLNEVPIENKKCSRYYKRFYLFDQYVRLLIRNGSCITLLSQPITISATFFWVPLQFQELVKYVFWTFSESFRLLLIDFITSFSLSTVQRCLLLLEAHSLAYGEHLAQDADEEVLWCLQKNSILQKDDRYEFMYRLDRENRTILLQKLQEAAALLVKKGNANEQKTATSVEILSKSSMVEEAKSVPFLHLLKPLKQNSSSTLVFIQESLAAAEFTFDLFSPVEKTSSGKNPQGLNGQIAAMIHFFFQHNYFIAGVSDRQIFTEYFLFSGNRIPKLGHYYAQFRTDPTYIKYTNKLKALKISKL